MDRREFFKGSLIAGLGSGLSAQSHTLLALSSIFNVGEQRGPYLFPKSLPSGHWFRFPALGFSEKVCGIFYSKQRPAAKGMPLGGIATGIIDLETDGTFGYCTLFNSIIPRRGPLKAPYLSLNTGGHTWILATNWRYGADCAHDIRYWGHYPVADLEYILDAPVSVGLRAWAPFIPGDTTASNTPGAIFELHLRNTSKLPRRGTLVFSFPGPTQAEAQISSDPDGPPYRATAIQFTYPTPTYEPIIVTVPAREPVARGTVRAERTNINGICRGIAVSSGAGNRVGYVLGTIGEEHANFGGGIESDATAWRAAGAGLPEPGTNDFGSSVAVTFDLDPGAIKVVRLLLAWYAPTWRGVGRNVFTQMYTGRFTEAKAVAQHLARSHARLLARILAWQQAVYMDEALPVWLRESLVNILHLISEDSLWVQAKPPIGTWCKPEDGLFTMIESPLEDPDSSCPPCDFYGNVALEYFFPDLAWSCLRYRREGWKNFRHGVASPFDWDGLNLVPSSGFAGQTATSGPSLVSLVDRYWLRTHDPRVLREMYPAVKDATIYIAQLRPEAGAEGLISVPAGDVNPADPHSKPGWHLEWFEADFWFGMTPHVGGIHLANFEIARRMAAAVGDKAFARQCQEWLQQGSKALEKFLWNGTYYLAYYEPETGRKSDLIFAYQLDGQWIARYEGLPDVFPSVRTKITLDTVARTCARLTRYGVANFSTPDGMPARNVGYGAYSYFPPELYMLGMTYMYEGKWDIGLNYIYRCVYDLAVRYGYTWRQPNVIRGDTGEKIFGIDYYQNMILWAVPAALMQADLSGPCRPGGLVYRVLQAGEVLREHADP